MAPSLLTALPGYLAQKSPAFRRRHSKNSTAPPAPAQGDAEQSTSSERPAAPADDQGRTLGLEDPNDPAMVDDTAVSRPGVLLPSEGVPYIDPRMYGGSSLDSSAGLGEPLNVIISGQSSAEIKTRKGLQSYLRSLDFDFECLGLHAGTPQKAFIDPRGLVDQYFIYRQVYTPLDHVFGTCIETLRGGNHLRAWQQQGTGAWFFACSVEQNVTKKHNIVKPDGYDLGRDQLVQKVTSKPDGKTSFFGKYYRTKVDFVTGLIPVGSQGVNHGESLDGKTAVLTVELLEDKAAAEQVGATATESGASSNNRQQHRKSVEVKRKIEQGLDHIIRGLPKRKATPQNAAPAESNAA